MDTPRTLPAVRKIKFSRRFGRIGIMLFKENIDGQYGLRGSKGREWTLSVWRNPKKAAERIGITRESGLISHGISAKKVRDGQQTSRKLG